MAPLAKPAIDAVMKNKTKFVPDRFAKIYYNWLENIRDWCISRQLWWGHRIPVWYCGRLRRSPSAPARRPPVCLKCGGAHLTQDEDVLDTWFSSALWPFSTLGWPDKTPEFEYFYPTDVLVTGYDIIPFWGDAHDVLGHRADGAKFPSTTCSSTGSCATSRAAR